MSERSIGSVVVALRAQDEVSGVIGSIQGAVAGITGMMSRMGGPMAEVGNAINTVFSGFATGGPAGAALAAGTVAIGAVVTGIQAAVKEASASEAVWASLGAAVDRSGASWVTLKDGTETALRAMERFTTYSDEQVAATMEKLMTFGLSYDQAMKALGPTLDFAAAKHMDLESAATLVGKAVDGNTAIMKRYGVDITVAKDATDKFTPVLTALNGQFGGAAQAAASTYAGTQERLNNAWQDVQVRVGNFFLPALASITEGMVSVTDSLGSGIDAMGKFFDEVAKSPQVKPVVDALGEAFGGLQKWFSDIGETIGTTLGPALKDLFDAFKEIWDALAPIGEALGELIAAFTGASGDNGIGILKIALDALVIVIRGFAIFIREDVVPTVKFFAQAFKEAADFISPIITTIKDMIGGFLKWLTDAFQAFYNFLVGGSLWMDMWDLILSIASTMIGTLLGDLGTKFFEPMKNLFTDAMGAVEKIWDTSWKTVQTAFTTITTAVGNFLNTKLEEMKTNLSTSTSQYAPIAATALTGMQSALNAGMDLIHGDWMGALTNMSNALTQWGTVATGIMTSAMGQLQGAVSAGVSAIQGMFSGLVASAQGALATIQGLFGQAQSLVNQIAHGIVAVTKPATDQFTNLFNQAATGVISAGQDLYNMLVGGSIWPDMFNTMESITSNSMTAIQNTVASGMASAVASAQAGLAQLQAMHQQAVAFTAAPTAGVTASAAAALAAAPVGTPAWLGAMHQVQLQQIAATTEFSPIFVAAAQELWRGQPEEAAYQGLQQFKPPDVVLNNTVVVDGATVAKTVEQRMIAQRQLGGGY